MPNLATRTREPEMIDDLASSEVEIAVTLRALARMNRLSRTSYFISQKIIKILGSARKQVRILDLGSGGGEILCDVSEHLRRRGIAVDAVGIDMNPHSVTYANRYAKRRNSSARFVVSTALEAAQELDYDIVISSLFLHHLSDEELITLFSVIRERAETGARIGLVMNDLRRSLPSYLLIWLTTNLMSRSHMVRHDGLVSAAAAFNQNELSENAHRANLQGCIITRKFPFRLMISWTSSFPK